MPLVYALTSPKQSCLAQRHIKAGVSCIFTPSCVLLIWMTGSPTAINKPSRATSIEPASNNGWWKQELVQTFLIGATNVSKILASITHGLAQHMSKCFKLSGINMTIRRVNYSYLMQMFLARKYKAPTLANQNQYQLHLRVTTLSDVTTRNGKRLTVNALNSFRDDTQPTYYAWSVQPRPPKVALILWIQALMECFTNHS